MPLCYLDSSALLKCYVPEVGSAWVQALVRTEPVSISELAFAEVASALGRRRQEGRLTSPEASAVYRKFLSDSVGYDISALASAVLQQAAAVLLDASAPRGLRTLDAIHIASAQTVFQRLERRPEQIGSFISADRALNAAARWAGLPVSNPEDQV